MTETLKKLSSPLVVTAAVATGLQAGTYYTWATGVMPGLARVDDQTFVHAFQQMNIAIVNPVFLASFLGAPAIAAAAAKVRQAFEPRWNRLNGMRALTSTASLAMLAWAAVRK
jgi:uncharacterized membrane protein